MTSIIVATDLAGAIGQNNQLLWHLPADMKFFRTLSTGHPIIMGRKTYDSIGKPLKDRTNIVVSRDKALQIEGCIICYDLHSAISLATSIDPNEIFIIGGAEIYRQALPLTDRIYLTLVQAKFPDADTFFPALDINWKLTEQRNYDADEKNVYPYSFSIYDKF